MDTRVAWVDPVNRDAFFLKLIVDVATRLGSPIDVFTTERAEAELDSKGLVEPFFKGVRSLPLGPIPASQRLRMLLGYVGGFNHAASTIQAGASVLYSSEVFVPALEKAGLGRLRGQARKVTRLVHNLDRTEMLLGRRSSRKLVDDWIFLSEYVRTAAVQSCGLDRDQTFVVLHPHFHPILEAVEPDPDLSTSLSRWVGDRKLLAYISRPTLAHGIDLFYRALATGHELGLPLCGVVIGRRDEGWTAGLDSAALAELGVTADVLRAEVGPYGYPQLLAVLGQADAVVAPYREISQSGAVALSIGEGVPVIASRAGANPELVRDGIDGFLLDPEDDGEVSTVLRRTYADGGTARGRLGGEQLGTHLDPFAAVTALLERIGS